MGIGRALEDLWYMLLVPVDWFRYDASSHSRIVLSVAFIIGIAGIAIHSYAGLAADPGDDPASHLQDAPLEAPEEPQWMTVMLVEEPTVCDGSPCVSVESNDGTRMLLVVKLEAFVFATDIYDVNCAIENATCTVDDWGAIIEQYGAMG